MNKDVKLQILKDAHKKYLDWWLPIDIACDSCLGGMSCHRFCESLLTYNDEWWDRWIGGLIHEDKKIAFKGTILTLIIKHYTKTIDLNK